ERPHLPGCAHQHGAVAVSWTAGILPAFFLPAGSRRSVFDPLLDIVGDHARFGFAIPDAAYFDALAEFVIGEQRFAQTAAIIGDQMRGGGEDVAGGAIIAFEPHHFGAGKIVLETEDVIDLGAAPAIDRLIVIADNAEIV